VAGSSRPPKQSLVLLNGFERWLESLARIAAEHGFSSPTWFRNSSTSTRARAKVR